MKNNFLILIFLTAGLLAGCTKKVPPLSERIAKVWIAQTVEEGSSTVYTRGGASNVRAGYANFKLDLSSSTAALTELDNNTFRGQWELEGDGKLILKNLNPQPSGTSGTIEYNIVSTEEGQLNLSRTTTSVKTGGTLNKYFLINP